MIVPMKKAKLVVMKDDKDELLKSLQKAGVFMPIPLPEGETAGGLWKKRNLRSSIRCAKQCFRKSKKPI
jgi:vacuolar-type H+-ATPase subunit I/STV1